ncbi:heterodisulfide reductase subunit A [Saccharomonospora amisosensis]|uniref:Heterodisulfide reductase subunit A n=1 Tax=Saccharomonospora amisosensis TaxID=1128677 RepID=A0A7X5ZS58_9PSEU|nr:FAD-dependent oxidoreductase [Saccharomonospora amisosensis]NIJ13015.1 heterodisulfide reductase subunit A [Saccharomonospora amisosensis]
MASDTVAVIGGGPGGLRAAHGIAEVGAKVVLIEQRDFLGGTPIAENYAGLTPHGEAAEPQMRRMAELVTSHPLAEVRLSTRVTGIEGEPGAFTLAVDGPDGAQRVDCGAVVVATGFQHFDPGRETQMYGYYEFPDVIALQDLEAMLKEHRVVRPSNGKPPERLCFIQCVGSRDRQIGNEYCSKVCCGVASKEAIEVRELLPDCKVYIFYIDMRMYGYWESEIYWPAQEKHHVQYVKGIVTEVLPKGDQLIVRGEDTTMGRPMEIPMDVVVLSVGMEPSAGTREMAKLLGVGQNRYGFIDSPGAPLDPVSTDREGIFACGAALGPADLEDTVSSASNAAMRAVSFVRSRAAAPAS